MKLITVKLSRLQEAFQSLMHLQNYEDPNSQLNIYTALNKALARGVNNKINTRKLRVEFLIKYQIISNSKTSISYSIPRGSSVMDLLEDAQAISLASEGVVAVYPPRLKNWSGKSEFYKKKSTKKTILVEALTPKSEFKTRAEQEDQLKEKGLRQAKLSELAAAHAANFIRVGKDLFGGNIIRVLGSKLYYGDGGLSEMDETDYVNNCRYKFVKTASTKMLKPKN